MGTHSALWGITAAVYLSLMGPHGMQELGQVILQRSQYLMQRLDEIPGVTAPKFQTSHFKEFVVDLNASGKTVQQINSQLRRHRIFGGLDLSREFPDWGQTALFCVTEVHTQQDLDRMAAALLGVLQGEGS